MVDIQNASEADSEEMAAGVSVAQLVHGERMNVQHARFAPGSDSGDGHSHPHEQVTYVAEGAVTMTIDGSEYDIAEGDSVLVPGGATHSVVNDGDEPAVLLDVFSPLREDLIS